MNEVRLPRMAHIAMPLPDLTLRQATRARIVQGQVTSKDELVKQMDETRKYRDERDKVRSSGSIVRTL